MILKKSFILIGVIFTLSVIFVGEIVYLKSTKTLTQQEIIDKNIFVKNVGLPDLSFYSNTPYIRHRSLRSVGDIYNVDGSLREYNLGSLVYWV